MKREISSRNPTPQPRPTTHQSQSQGHSPPPQVAASRFPAPASKLQVRRLQHARRTAPHLPRKVTTWHLHVSSVNLHHTTSSECFRHFLSALTSTKIAILAETSHEDAALRQQPQLQIPLSKRHPTPPTNHHGNANPTSQRRKLTISPSDTNVIKTQRLRDISHVSSTCHVSCLSPQNPFAHCQRHSGATTTCREPQTQRVLN